MGLLRVAVLGPPEVFHDGSRLTFALRKAQALLLYLAVEGGMHPRSKLAALLWPDSELPDARKTLRNAITLLRHLLTDAGTAPSQHSHLLSQGELLGLDPHAPLELDLDVVQQAYHQVQRLFTVSSQEQYATLVARLQHALSLVRGPFLDGFWLREEAPFDEWHEQQQRQWQMRLHLLLDRLSSWQEAAGEQEQARHPQPLAGARSAAGGGVPAPDACAAGAGRCKRRLAGLCYPAGAVSRGVARQTFGGHGRPG